jgi:hypothetical protein
MPILPDGYSAHQAFEAITGGFIGSPPQRNAWWAAIPDPTKEALKNSFAQNPDGTPALENRGQIIYTCITLLLSTIYKHFCGPFENTKWQHREALLNLRISTLRDYSWYKQNFRIDFLDDFNSAIWKDKLIAGLPKGFADLVRA